LGMERRADIGTRQLKAAPQFWKGRCAGTAKNGGMQNFSSPAPAPRRSVGPRPLPPSLPYTRHAVPSSARRHAVAFLPASASRSFCRASYSRGRAAWRNVITLAAADAELGTGCRRRGFCGRVRARVCSLLTYMTARAISIHAGEKQRTVGTRHAVALLQRWRTTHLPALAPAGTHREFSVRRIYSGGAKWRVDERQASSVSATSFSRRTPGITVVISMS